MRLAQRLIDAWPTFGNDIELLTDTNRTLGLIEQALLSATELEQLRFLGVMGVDLGTGVDHSNYPPGFFGQPPPTAP